MSSPKIPEGLQAFLRHAESLHPSNNARRENGFAKEFQQLKDMSSKLKRDPEYTTHQGELDYNRIKNRYKDILPFDKNRIVLPTLPGVQGSDYINGNYVKGPDGKNAYLALQGPLPRTVDDFWRLIASHRCQIVIMVCREIEMGKLKCKRYWPESKDEILTFAGLEISLISEDNLAEGFIMRTMCMKSDKEEMTVTQLQYTAWPDHDVPKSAAPLIELNRTLRAIQGNRRQVALIHCSAGCGRTGTICAVDYAWTLLKMQNTSNFSVFDIVAGLRRQRMAMVQTKEQYALVYKAVVQLVQEELEKEKLKSHTYVNVEIPAASQSPNGRGDYENCEFMDSINRWKQNDLQSNGSVPKAVAPLPAPTSVPKETKTNSKPQPKPQPANRLPMSTPKSDGAAVVKSNAPTTSDYVNLEFPREVTNNVPLSPVKVTNDAPSAQPRSPTRSNMPSLNLNEVKAGSKGPAAVRQKSPTTPDYEVMPKRTPGSGAASPGNDKPPQKNKKISTEYEFPAMVAPQKQSKEVPEGLLIDLGDDLPPLPSKRHSADSTVTKDGSGSRYENVEVKPKPRPGSAPHRSNSSPNVLDDSWLFGLQPTVNSSPPGVHPGGSKENADSRAFHTLPNRMHPDSGPKRCPLTADVFQDPGVSSSAAGAAGGGGGSGFGVMQSSQGQYCLVGAVSPSSPPKVMTTPQFVPQPNQGSQLQKQKPPVEGHNSSQPKRQGDRPKSRTPVGAYSLVGIPEVSGQSPVFYTQGTVSTPATVKSDPIKANAGVTVEVNSMPNTGNAVEIKGSPIAEPSSYELVGQWPQPAKVTPPSVHPYTPGPPNMDAKKAAKDGSVGQWPQPAKVTPPSVHPYKPGPANMDAKKAAKDELIGQWPQPAKRVSPPSVQPYKPGLSNMDVKKAVKEEAHASPLLPHKADKQKPVAGSEAPLDVSLRRQGDGAPLDTSDVTVAPDLYASVVPRSCRDKADSKDRNSLSGGSPNLRTQSSSGSLRSFTSTSSDEGDTPPAIPQKTNEAFQVPGM
ncbi:hypothetical protein ACROYT_G033865 [Oculina patagonica]